MEAGIAVKLWRKVFAKGNDGMGFLTSAIRQAAGELISPNDYAKQIKTYKGIVFACVKFKSNAVAAVPFKLYATQTNGRKLRLRGTHTREVSMKQTDFIFSQKILQPYVKQADSLLEITEHPVLELLRNVNGHKNALDLRFETEMFLSLTGNTYWYLPKNGLGKPGMVWIIHPQYMRVVPNEDGTIKEYIYKRGTKTIPYQPDEIIHFTQPSPHMHYYGMGDVAGASDAIGLRDYMTAYEQNVFKGMGYPEIALKSTKNLSEDDIKKLERSWGQRYGGVSGKKVALLQDWLSIEPLQITNPRDMQFKVGWDTMREEVCAGFGVPISFFTEKSNALGGKDEAERRFARYTVLPDVQRQVEKLNEQLITKYDARPGAGYFFGYPNPVPEDEEMKLKETEMLINAGVITRDEGRARYDYLPVGADELLVPGTLTPIDALGDDGGVDKDISRRVHEKLRQFA